MVVFLLEHFSTYQADSLKKKILIFHQILLKSLMHVVIYWGLLQQYYYFMNILSKVRHLDLHPQDRLHHNSIFSQYIYKDVEHLI